MSDFDNFWFDEYIHILHGQAVLIPDNESSFTFHSGDHFFAPKGYDGKWFINSGNVPHYELSVISTQRSDSTLVSSSLLPSMVKPSTISGADIQLDQNGSFEKTIRSGVELTLTFHANEPREDIIDIQEDQMIHLLSGKMTLNYGSDIKEFFTGDFFIIPKGFEGNCIYEGHGLIKYLSVTKSS